MRIVREDVREGRGFVVILSFFLSHKCIEVYGNIYMSSV